MTARPSPPLLCRTALFVPAANPRALDKARALPADAVIVDLEDSVAPAAKPAARAAMLAALAAGFGPRLRLVRVNAPGSAWGRDDLGALAGAAVDGVLLPKVGTAAELDLPAALLPGCGLWPMIETAQGVLNAAAIAAHPAVAGLVVGGNDLAADLRLPLGGGGRAALTTALDLVVLAARAQGRMVLDGVFTDLSDPAGLARDCARARAQGFDGKTVIHPAQIAPANAAFAPDLAELTQARRVIAAMAAAEADGQGVALLDGRMVEALHAAAARRVLAQDAAIAARGAAAHCAPDQPAPTSERR